MSNTVSIDDKIIEQANKLLDNYINGENFEKKTDNMLASIKTDLLKQSERTARNWAGIAAGLIFFIFFILLSWQYVQIREKQADIHAKYSEALDLIIKIKEKVNELDTKILPRINQINKNVISYEDRIQGLQTSTQAYEERVKNLQTTMQTMEFRLELIKKVPNK